MGEKTMKKIFGFWAIAALLMAGCENSESVPVVEDGVMTINVLHPSATRVTATSFESGDTIGLYATEYDGEVAKPLQISGNWINNAAVTYNGAVWTPEKNLYWSNNTVDVYGYYPYMKPVSIDEQPFAVALDQSIETANGVLGGYEASDFMWAKASGLTAADGEVQLAFKHCCSRLIVKLVKGEDYDGDFPSTASLFIHNVVPTATIDFTTGAVVKDVFGEPTTIKAHKVDDGTYEAIIVPQRITSRRPFIELVANNISYLLEDTFYFKAGTQHTIYLTINSNPNQIKVDIGGEVDGGEW